MTKYRKYRILNDKEVITLAVIGMTIKVKQSDFFISHLITFAVMSALGDFLYENEDFNFKKMRAVANRKTISLVVVGDKDRKVIRLGEFDTVDSESAWYTQ